VELDALNIDNHGSGGLTLAPVNKVHHVHTIARVAEMLGEDEDWLWDVANEMDQEDGLIWGYGPDKDTVMAFTDFGIETLTEIIKITRSASPKKSRCVLRRMLTSHHPRWISIVALLAATSPSDMRPSEG